VSKKSACKAKIRYVTEEQARAAADRTSAFYGEPVKVYECPVCRSWHTTKKKDRGL